MDFLYEDTENTQIKYVSFIGDSNSRFDLAIIPTDRFYGKKIVINLQSGKSALIGKDDLEEEGYLEYAFQLTEEEAKDLNEFLLSNY